MQKTNKKSKPKFLKIVCPRCSNKQIVYGKSTSRIKCKKCNLLLNKPTGGKTKVKALVKAIFRKWK